MDGAWTSADGSRSYRVALRGTEIRYDLGGRRYADVTSEEDAAFEARVQAFFRAALHGDKAGAARLMSYPLSVRFPNGANRNFRSAAEVLAAWNEVFTPAMMAKLAAALPHDMFVHEGMAMTGAGEAWFDAKGLASLNVPPAAAPGH